MVSVPPAHGMLDEDGILLIDAVTEGHATYLNKMLEKAGIDIELLAPLNAEHMQREVAKAKAREDAGDFTLEPNQSPPVSFSFTFQQLKRDF